MSDKFIRIDKWIWFARVVKSRTLAQKFVRSGKIRINREKIVNPARTIGAGDVLTITLERKILVLEVVECGKRRGPFVEACKLYQDLTPIPDVEESGTDSFSDNQDHKIPRPDKQNRRKLIQLKNRQYFQ